MYLQITTACNMTCEHCCFAATGKGDRMERDVYMAALQLAIRYGEYVTIGGGEPTTHKEFFPYLEKAIEFYQCGSLESPPMVITNGKVKSKALRLLEMVEDEQPLHVELSQDPWHDAIDPLVVRRYYEHDRRRYRMNYGSSAYERGSAGVRSVSRIVPVGRAIKFSGALPLDHSIQCACEDVLVDPRGDLWSCGCKHTKIGSVWDRNALDGYCNEFAHQGGYAPQEVEQEEEALL